MANLNEKEMKKMKKRRNKEKNKPTREEKKRGHPSTPTFSDDSGKPQTQQSTNVDESSDLCHAKAQTAVEEASCTDQEGVNRQIQESLRTICVSMDTSNVTQQVESIERNIAFLQKEHQVLLTGLRLEIRHLKKRCNDIATEEEFLQARILQTEHHIAEQECSQGELKAKLRHKGEQASALQVRLREEERRFLEELKRRSHKITALSRDLRKQTDIAAQLTFQLHSARFRLYHQAEEGEGEKDEEKKKEEEEERKGERGEKVLTARPEARHRSHCSARLRRSERVRECVPQERILGPEKPSPMPDPALFLYPFPQRLLPLHISLRGHCGEGDSQRQMGRLRTRVTRDDTRPETTDL
ncbi:coiled-coil domain-containing protein 92-like [Silurus meridionalis]|nr:coiled-coil domain-containing protein 92-like [Silurus meridionalis]